MAIGPALHLGEVAAAAAFDHVAGQREGRAGEPQQRGLLRQRRAGLADRLIDRRQMLGQPRARQSWPNCDGIGQRLELRAFALLEPDFLAERIGHHQDVGKDDRRIEPEAADRLQRDLDGLVRRVAEFEERSRRGADGAILRQVAPGLTHQPDRRRRQSASRPASPGTFPARSLLSLMLPLTLFIIGSSSSRGCGTWGCALLDHPSPGRCGSAKAEFHAAFIAGFPIRRSFLPDCPQGTNVGTARASRVLNRALAADRAGCPRSCRRQSRVSPGDAVG